MSMRRSSKSQWVVYVRDIANHRLVCPIGLFDNEGDARVAADRIETKGWRYVEVEESRPILWRTE